MHMQQGEGDMDPRRLDRMERNSMLKVVNLSRVVSVFMRWRGEGKAVIVKEIRHK